MPSPHARIYPKSGRALFDGGKNNKYEKSIIEDNESPDCANVIFENGSVKTRGGTDRLNTTSIGSFSNHGLYTRHNNDGSETMVAWHGGTPYTWDASTFATIGSGQSIFTAGVNVGSAEMENYIYFGNGSNPGYKYNGDFTRHGVPAPNSGPTPASAPTGNNLSGQYQYKITYVNSALVESDTNGVTATFTATGDDIRLTSIPVAPQSYGINARRIYRTVDSGVTFFRVAEISDNTTTTYDDAIADADLGVEAPTDQGEPPQYSTILYHQDRLFMNDPANPNYIWWTELGNPYVVKATSFQRIGDKSGELVRALGVYDNSLVIFTDNQPWILYMPSSDPTEWRLIKSRAAYGSMSPFGVAPYQNKMLFPALKNDKIVGFSALSGDTVDPSATLLTVSVAGSDMQSDRVEPDVLLFPKATASNIFAQVFENKMYLAVTYGSGETVNNRVYVMDFSISNLAKNQKTSWVPFTYASLKPGQMTVYDGNLYFGSRAEDGFVYKMNTASYNDNSSAIDSYFWTKEYAGYKGDETFTKDFRYTELLFEKPGNYYMDLTYKSNSDLGAGTTQQVDLNPGGSLWGTMVWGTDNWGGGVEEEQRRVYLGSLRGERIQFKFSNQNTADQKFGVHGLSFIYNVKGRR